MASDQMVSVSLIWQLGRVGKGPTGRICQTSPLWSRRESHKTCRLFCAQSLMSTTRTTTTSGFTFVCVRAGPDWFAVNFESLVQRLHSLLTRCTEERVTMRGFHIG